MKYNLVYFVVRVEKVKILRNLLARFVIYKLALEVENGRIPRVVVLENGVKIKAILTIFSYTSV